MQDERYGIESLGTLLQEQNIRKFMLVADGSFPYLSICGYFDTLDATMVKFDAFSPNPLHDDADKGLELFLKEGCEALVAVGGGSSIDVAKCIKLDGVLNVPLIAIPTTAGTGSESTPHIVVYREGKKESLGNETTVPTHIIFEPRVLKTLPLYQKKCTMLDALCQAAESWWNVRRTPESIAYSHEAISLIMQNWEEYIFPKSDEAFDQASKAIMRGANLSGKAIAITATTAPHAMSYKMTSLYHLPHGHAVAIGFPVVWKEMLEINQDRELYKIFKDLANDFQCKNPEEAVDWFFGFLKKLELNRPHSDNKAQDIALLVDSVNPVRLKNNPIAFTIEELKKMYEEIVE